MTIRLRRSFVFLAAALVAATFAFSFVHPSHSRQWNTDHARLPSATIEGNQVHIEGIRNFRSVSADSYRVAYYDKTFDLDRIETVWLVLSVFNPDGARGPAHTMLSFGFEGGEYIAISVEARKEVGESYSPFRGLFKKYEIIYVIGDERDLVLTRAVHRTDEVYVYPIRTSPKKVRALFVDILRAAERLREQPQFYNTLTNNCTTKLRDHVNRIAPGRIPQTWKVILPGYTDELIRDLGLLDSVETLEAARDLFRINERARQFATAPDFSIRIREPRVP